MKEEKQNERQTFSERERDRNRDRERAAAHHESVASFDLLDASTQRVMIRIRKLFGTDSRTN